jgi:lipid A disaccharide synthetase
MMTEGSREKDIKLLVAKFITLVESLNPGERLSIRKVAAKKKTSAKKKAAAKKSVRAGSRRSPAKREKP